MTRERKHLVLSLGAFLVALLVLAWLWRRHLAQTAQAVTGVQLVPQPSPDLITDFPIGTGVTSFSGDPPVQASPDMTGGGGSPSLVPLFGFIATGPYGYNGFAG